MIVPFMVHLHNTEANSKAIFSLVARKLIV